MNDVFFHEGVKRWCAMHGRAHGALAGRRFVLGAVLAALGNVDFTRLSDAYGPATEVPGALVALARATDEGAALGTLAFLEDRLAHQGTAVPEICLASLPFLVEIGEAKVAASAGVLALLGRIGAGGRDEDGIPVDPVLARRVKAATAAALCTAFAEQGDGEPDARRRAGAPQRRMRCRCSEGRRRRTSRA